MIQSDILGVVCVYVYVALLLLLTEKGLKKYAGDQLRKVLHIMVGNIVFILPIFQTREAMAFIAAAPFILLTYLISPRSPIKGKSRVSQAGHGLGLVYYAITWTILAYAFFDQLWIVGAGILAMSYGDGFASVIGAKYGKHPYQVFRDRKSLEGTAAMLLITVPVLIIDLIFYSVPITALLVTVVVAATLIATAAEALTPRGLDNLTVPLLAAAVCWLLTMGL